MKLTFYGGAESVTGANYVLESAGYRMMIDCGLVQGGHFAEAQNFEPFAYDVKSIQSVCITHAHLDHIGRLPRLYQDGFRGKIFSTPPTKDFAEVTLVDSMHILNKEAEREGKAPFCTLESIQPLMDLWQGVGYHKPFQLGPFAIEFYNAGHVLGSACIKVQAEGKTIVFSGDLGNYPTPIIKPLEAPPPADYCLVESAYGDRVHESGESRQGMLEDAIEDTVKAGGTLLIPVFALERTQEILYHLHGLFQEKRIPKVPVFIDSPLAIKMTAVYAKYENYFNTEAYALVKKGDDILNFPELHLTLTTEQSKNINSVPPPKIIMAGSGMSQGGRILHHEARYLPDPKSMILFVGYQAAGSLGRQIMDGAKEVTLFGEHVPILCQKRTITAYSAHADQPRLFEWVKYMRLTLKKVFVVQGEPASSLALSQKIKDELAVPSEVPKIGEEVTL
jgi:metallo-beta-lactamase family protein